MPSIFLYQDTKNRVHHYRDMGIYRADVASSSRKYKFILTCLCVGLLGIISLPFLGKAGNSVMGLMDVYYIQWNGGFGLIFDDGDFPGLSIAEKYDPFKAAKKNPNRSFVAKGSTIKEESPFNIVNGERIKAIVEEDGTLLFHNISPASEYRAGKKILSKMTEVC